MRDYLVPVYITYLIATVGLVSWLATTLHRNGAVFLTDVFEGRPEMATSVNRLLVTGFAMLNLGYGFFLMTASEATSATEAFEVLSRKLGLLLLLLAGMHFVNLFVFHRISERRRQRELVPPVAPQRWTQKVDPAPPATPAGAF